MVSWCFGSLRAGDCARTYPGRVSCISSQLGRCIFIRITSLVFVEWVMLTTVWSLPLSMLLFVCQAKEFLPKLKKNKTLKRRGPYYTVLVSVSSSAWARWRGNFLSACLSGSTGFKQIPICAGLYSRGRKSPLVYHPEEMPLAPWTQPRGKPGSAALCLLRPHVVLFWQGVLDVNAVAGIPTAQHLPFHLGFSKW